jgi:Spy/CpxP family protein refolding chaperone
MKRFLIPYTILMSIVALTATASEEPRERSRSEGELAQYLQLTPAQQTAWQNARSEFRAIAQPLFAKRQELGEQAETALKDKTADACTVGSLMVASQAVSDQIRAARETLTQKMQSVLTPDQKTKYEAFAAAERHGRERE